jgi:hypothetical protein
MSEQLIGGMKNFCDVRATVKMEIKNNFTMCIMSRKKPFKEHVHSIPFFPITDSVSRLRKNL